VIRADAVDPGVYLGRIDIEASGQLSTSLGDAFGLSGDAAIMLGFCFRTGTNGILARSRIDGVREVPPDVGGRRLPG